MRQRKHLLPLIQILNEVVANMVVQMRITGVTVNVDGSTTLACCDINYAQRGWIITILGDEYLIDSISRMDQTITVSKVDGGTYIIAPGTTFNLYPVKFFHGTPRGTSADLVKIPDALAKTPMIWLWENFTEEITQDEMIERTIPVELYALTTFPERSGAMVNDDIHTECVEPMVQLLECLRDEFAKRSDIFFTDFFKYKVTPFPKFGVYARSAGSTKSLMCDDLSGAAMYTTLELFYKDPPCGAGDECDVAPTIPSGISFWDISGTFQVQ